MRRRVDHSRGRPEKPLTPAELRQKFDTCAGRAMDAARAGRVAQLIDGLEGLDSVRELCEMLACTETS